jgi:hypothetical protein
MLCIKLEKHSTSIADVGSCRSGHTVSALSSSALQQFRALTDQLMRPRGAGLGPDDVSTILVLIISRLAYPGC